MTRAEADLERLRVTLADAEQKLTRAKELCRAQPDSRRPSSRPRKSTSSQRRRRSSSSEAGLTQARVAAQHAGGESRSHGDPAPIDGIVISRNVDQGQTVAASMNAPVLYSLAADLTKMQVVASIDEAEIGKMRPGQPVNFRVDAYPTETFRGTVQQVRLQPTTVQNVVTYSTVISVPNEELKLKPGMTANVTIEISRKNNVLRDSERGAPLPSDHRHFRGAEAGGASGDAARLRRAADPVGRAGRGGQRGAVSAARPASTARSRPPTPAQTSPTPTDRRPARPNAGPELWSAQRPQSQDRRPQASATD